MKNKPMTPDQLLNKLIEAGDATVDYINSAGKKRYAVVTVDFSTPYVQAKVAEKADVALVEGDLVTAFSWDADKLIRIPASKVVGFVPLAQVLNNGVHGA